MASRHTISHASSIFVGNPQHGGANNGNRGVPWTQHLRANLGAPATAAANNVATSQTVTGAGTAFSLNGTLVSGGVATLDVPRNVVAAWTNTAVITITGKDQYGDTVVESSASGTSHTGKKAFKTITGITTSATITGATVGTGVVLGLPYRLDGAYDILARYGDTTADTGTIAAAVTTNPATATTGDVRGTWSPSSAPNGSIVYRIHYSIYGLDDKSDAFGVAQYGG